MNFRESEAYLLSLGNEVTAMKLGLENISKLLAALGDPQNNYKKIQIAGTNGKGSVCAFLDSICLQASIKTGRFTSPHLISITERIKIAGQDIGEEDFARHSTLVRQTAENLVAEGDLQYIPTYFEQVTAIALIAFAEARIELAILETGLGGRYDATTAANAEIAAITRIDLDHQEYLGDTIEKIAAEKAAIIRPDTEAVIIGEQFPEAEKVILDRCAQFNLNSCRTACVSGWVPLAPYGNVRLGLKGTHQIENAKIAILLAEELRKHFQIDNDHILRGLETAAHPGRLEYVGSILLDGAHNPGGAKALTAFLDEFENRPVTMIYGAMRDKDVGEISKILFPRAEHLILTTPQNSRALPAAELAAFAADADRVHTASNAKEALELARELAGEGVIVVTGSLYLVGEMRGLINKTLDNV